MKYLLFIFLFIISKYNFGQSPDYGLKVFKKLIVILVINGMEMVESLMEAQLHQ